MDMYYLTREEDTQLMFSIMLPGSTRSLYEYFCQLPLEDLQAYPKKGYHNWMSRAARSPQALEMRDYILFWRLAAEKIREQYSRAYLETLSDDNLDFFLGSFLRQTPLWVYEDAISDIIQILCHRSKLQK